MCPRQSLHVGCGAYARSAPGCDPPRLKAQAARSARDSSRTYASVGVVTEQDLRCTSASDAAQAYNRLANVRSFLSASGNSGIAIRGLNAEGVTQPSRAQPSRAEPSRAAPVISVLVDGAPQNIESIRRGSRGIWDVEQIEVLRGPQSTL